MPCLPSEPFVFPQHLFCDAREALPDYHGKRWLVLHTRPRQEKCLARDLQHLSIPYYLPLLARRRRTGGRVDASFVPLFPGYLALWGDDSERLSALQTRRVVNVLSVPNQDQFWLDMRGIHRLIESGMPITREDRLAAGDRVVVRGGPLAGLEGTILRTASGRRFLVQVDFMQRGASVLANDFDLEAIA